jgi:hypothetical protein
MSFSYLNDFQKTTAFEAIQNAKTLGFAEQIATTLVRDWVLENGDEEVLKNFNAVDATNHILSVA